MTAPAWVSMLKPYLQDVLAVLQVRTKDLMVHCGAAAAIIDFSAGVGAERAGMAARAARRRGWKCMVIVVFGMRV